MCGHPRIPGRVRDLITRCESETFYIAQAGTYAIGDLAAGRLSHLGLGWDGTTVTGSTSIVPPADNGRWSKYNVEGRVCIRKDLPKVEKSLGGWEMANFGDPSKGCHTHHSVRKVYQRETWYGQRLPIVVDVQAPEHNQVTIAFRVGRVFARTDIDERDLGFACSLLRENVDGRVHAVSTVLSVADRLKTLLSLTEDDGS